jgi:hypothetical protein
MSVPAPREPHQGGRWETIRYALDTNPRTFRLCLILSVATVTPCLAAVIAEMIRHLWLWGVATAVARSSSRTNESRHKGRRRCHRSARAPLER